MGGNSMGLVGVETPSATRPGGPTSSANLLAEGDRPGPIGMNTPSIPAEELSGGGTVNAQTILTYASDNEGKHVGKLKQCWDLANLALKKAGAKSAEDYGTVTADSDDVWGSSVTLADAKPGDIIQFRNYSFDAQDTYSDGVVKNGPAESRSHHTAIVKSVGSDGEIEVWEQNAPTGEKVRKIKLYFKDASLDLPDDVKRKIKVTGKFWIYRPQPRK